MESGQIADDGSEIEFADLGNQAFNGDGTELYVASPDGIVVFGRDPDTGELSMMDTLVDHPILDSDTRLIWDGAGSALLVASCDAWLKFTAAEDGGIEHTGSIEGAPCVEGDVLMQGDIVHHVFEPYMIETFRFDEGHDALSPAGDIMIPDIAHAVMTADGGNIYAVTDDDDDHALYVVERDAEDGSLDIASILREGSPTGPDGEAVVEGLEDVLAMAVHGSHLFLTAGSRGDNTVVFDLADPASPVFLAELRRFRGGFARCRHSLARQDALAVDVVCPNEYYVVQVGVDGSVYGSDWFRSTRLDSFGNTIPRNGRVGSIGASPDGRHLYVTGDYFGIILGPDGLIFIEGEHVNTFERVYD